MDQLLHRLRNPQALDSPYDLGRLEGQREVLMDLMTEALDKEVQIVLGYTAESLTSRPFESYQISSEDPDPLLI